MHCNDQFGYKKNHSTESLVLEIVDETLIGFDQKTANILILLDMSAAFDTVDLRKLLSILENKIGLKGTVLKWFQSFLLGRHQKVKVNGVLSGVLMTLYGVPQGSVLGPVLFNIYVSSLSSVMKNQGLLASSYADDTNTRIKLNLSFQYYTISHCIPQLMNDIYAWMNSHFLKLNPQKTEIILLCPPQFKNVDKLNGAFINNNCIRFSDRVKLLGVHIDCSLSFDYHISSLVSNCMFHLKNIAKIKRFLTRDETEKLIHAFMTSKFDYCNALLYGVKSTSLSKLQAVQNKAARTLLSLPSHEPVTDEGL